MRMPGLLNRSLKRLSRIAWSRGANESVLDRLLSCTDELDQWGQSLRNRYKEDIHNSKKRIDKLQELGNFEADGEVVKLKLKTQLFADFSIWVGGKSIEFQPKPI